MKPFCIEILANGTLLYRGYIDGVRILEVKKNSVVVYIGGFVTLMFVPS